MIVVQNNDGGYLVGPFPTYEEADRYIALMPYPDDWSAITVDAPDWEEFE